MNHITGSGADENSFVPSAFTGLEPFADDAVNFGSPSKRLKTGHFVDVLASAASVDQVLTGRVSDPSSVTYIDLDGTSVNVNATSLTQNTIPVLTEAGGQTLTGGLFTTVTNFLGGQQLITKTYADLVDIPSSQVTDFVPAVDNRINIQKNVPFGVAGLDGSSKVPIANLSVSGVTYCGVWDATSNTPTLASGTGTTGCYYVVNVAGTTNLDGINEWQVKDWAIFDGTLWGKVDNTDQVTAVANKQGSVFLQYGTDLTDVDIIGGTIPNRSIMNYDTLSGKWINQTRDTIGLTGLEDKTQNITSTSGVTNVSGSLVCPTIIGLNDPVNAQDASTKTYVDTIEGVLPNLRMGGYSVEGVKKYVENISSPNVNSDTVAVTFEHGSSSTARYSDGVYNPILDRIYYVPNGLGSVTIWSYLDCATNTVVDYTHGATVVDGAYSGGCYVPTLRRIYMAPASQSNQSNWHYIDCDTGQVVPYSNALGITTTAYRGAVYSPLNDRVYFVPAQQGNQPVWHYIRCSDETIQSYANGRTDVVAGAYYYGCYSPTLDRIYMAPFIQSNQSTWHYIQCATATVVAYASNFNSVNAGYIGATYSPIENKIYFIPYSQSSQPRWHRINCTLDTLEPFIAGGTYSLFAYAGAVLSPTQNRIYMVPFGQGPNAVWHYINCNTGTVVPYNKQIPVTVTNFAYNGGSYSPTTNTIHFAPSTQADETIWHYLRPLASSIVSKTFASSVLMGN
jgi:hypothetical protein